MVVFLAEPMYGTSLSFSRLKGDYDYDRLGGSGQKWSSARLSDAGSSAPATRRNRYSRASTTSVTQLLSDSCSNLLQKLTTKVRGPSATIERNLHRGTDTVSIIPKLDNNSNIQYTSARNRIEDKYASVLDRIYGRKRDDRTLEPSVGRALAKSATTSSVFLLSEKAYPYVHHQTNSAAAPREKTPYRGEGKSQQRKQYPEPPYTYLDSDNAYRLRHKSTYSELRPRRSAKPLRTGKSESEQRKAANLRLCPVEIPLVDGNGLLEDETTPTPAVPDPVSEREAKRKEIQSLIMKYSALDEAYNRGAGTGSAAAVASIVPSAATAIARKYNSRLTTAVSNGRVRWVLMMMFMSRSAPQTHPVRH